jgi:zinc transport system substrate-binding protein
MRKIAYLVALCMALVWHGVGNETNAAAAPKVVASIKPVHSLVSSIMKGIGNPSLLVDGGGSPHSYAMKPSQATVLQGADIVFWIGEELETFLAKPIATLAKPAKAAPLIEAGDIQLLELREGNHHHEGEHKHKKHGGYDQHIWLDPQNAIAMAGAIERALKAADAANTDVYSQNASDLVARLTALQGELDGLLVSVRTAPFIVFHDGYKYFEQRFSLNHAGAIAINPEVPQSAKRIRAIRTDIKKSGAKCVFSEPQFEPRIVSTVIEDSKTRTAELDPLGASFKAGAEQYFQMMRAMGQAFHDCLGDTN